jgi:hypothetical protein
MLSAVLQVSVRGQGSYHPETRGGVILQNFDKTPLSLETLAQSIHRTFMLPHCRQNLMDTQTHKINNKPVIRILELFSAACIRLYYPLCKSTVGTGSSACQLKPGGFIMHL